MKTRKEPTEPLPKQHQQEPGKESAMKPIPHSENPLYAGSGKLHGHVAIITGGDSGIGRAVAILFAREGADVAIMYLAEDEDAQKTKSDVEKEGQACLLLKGDVSHKSFCEQAVSQIREKFGHITVLVNNAGEQHPQESIMDITEEQLVQTFETNIFAYFYMVQAVLPCLSEGSSIINTTSVTAYKGSAHLLDYSATKGAIVTFTRSLALNLAGRHIRVNGVAPGPIWTPLIPSTFSPERVETFGKDVPFGRPGQPEEIAPSYVFLASEDSSYMTGQILHPNGGTIVNG